MEIIDENRRFKPTSKLFYDSKTGEQILCENIEEAVEFMTNKYTGEPFDIVVGYYVTRKFKRG